jgi:hypothetical protein
VDISENELELWYNSQDHFAIQLKPPGSDWLPLLEPGEYIENLELPSGTFVSIYNELYAATNGQNYIACYLSPFFSEEGIVGIQAGTWLVRLQGREIRDGRYHAWIERDDPRRLGRAGLQEYWSFPSFLSERSNVDDTSISSLACGNYIISVANLDEVKGGIHITSSQGPTRDGRQKPDIAAPGTDIIAANGFNPAEPWISMTGTSMASPYVAGVIGLMLSAEPQLTAAQICAILCRTAKPLAEAGFKWCNDAGYGQLDAAACLAEIARLKERKDRTE